MWTNYCAAYDNDDYYELCFIRENTSTVMYHDPGDVIYQFFCHDGCVTDNIGWRSILLALQRDIHFMLLLVKHHYETTLLLDSPSRSRFTSCTMVLQFSIQWATNEHDSPRRQVTKN